VSGLGPIWGARLADCRPGGARRSYLASRARPARGPRRAARPSAGNRPPHPRRAPVAGPVRPRRPPWPLARPARPARCALLAAAAAAAVAAAARPRNRGEITPPNDRPAPGAAAARAGASPGCASQPIRAHARAASTNQWPSNCSQPRCPGRGRSWAQLGAEAWGRRASAPCPAPPSAGPGSGPRELEHFAAQMRLGYLLVQWVEAKPEVGISSVVTLKRLLYAGSAKGGRWAACSTGAFSSIFIRCSASSRADLQELHLPRPTVSEVRGPCLLQLCASLVPGAQRAGSEPAPPQELMFFRGEDRKRMEMTSGVIIRFVERLTLEGG
jgi:hypothetical protein